MPHLFWIIDSLATNSYKILQELDSNWRRTHKYFKCYLAWAMVLESTAHDDMFRRSQQVAKSKHVQERAIAKGVAEAGGYFRNATAKQAVLVSNFECHCPVKLAHDARRDCFNCRVNHKEQAAGKQRRKTCFKCAACGLFCALVRIETAS